MTSPLDFYTRWKVNTPHPIAHGYDQSTNHFISGLLTVQLTETSTTTGMWDF